MSNTPASNNNSLDKIGLEFQEFMKRASERGDSSSPSPSPSPSSSSVDDLWAVLVAGDHFDINGASHEFYGGHTSIQPIGNAYKFLRKFLPKDRIIVIAQVNEVIAWHDLPTEKKIDKRASESSRKAQMAMWPELAAQVRECLNLLIEEGGADYDRDECNSDTLLRVLRGSPMPTSTECASATSVGSSSGGNSSTSGKKVIQYSPIKGRTKVFLPMFSHGNWKEEAETHYFLMPKPSSQLYEIFSKSEFETFDLALKLTSNPFVPLASECDSSTSNASSSSSSYSTPAISVYSDLISPISLRSHQLYVLNVFTSIELPEITQSMCIQLMTLYAESKSKSGYLPKFYWEPQSLEAAVRRGDIKVNVHVIRDTDACDSAFSECDAKRIPNWSPDTFTHHTETSDELFKPLYGYTPLFGESDENRGMFASLYRNFTPHRIPALGSEPPSATKPPEKMKIDSRENKCLNNTASLHWQFLFETLRVVMDLYLPTIFICMNSCGSGGMWLFLKNERYQRMYNVDSWPLFVYYTAEPGTSAVGNAWEAFFISLQDSLFPETDPESSPFSITKGGSYKLDDLKASIMDQEGSQSMVKVAAAGETSPSSPRSKALSSANATEPVTTFADFYDKVDAYYWDTSPTVKEIRDMDPELRAECGMAIFGVIGHVYGKQSGVEKTDLHKFFGVSKR